MPNQSNEQREGAIDLEKHAAKNAIRSVLQAEIAGEVFYESRHNEARLSRLLENAENALSEYVISQRLKAREEGKKEERDNLIGKVVKCSTGFDTIGNKRIWHVDIDELEAALTKDNER